MISNDMKQYVTARVCICSVKAIKTDNEMKSLLPLNALVS
jgi:hypothetical protein